MKILHITVTLSERGGAETMLQNIISNDKDNEHSVLSLRDFDSDSNILKGEGVQCYSLGLPPGKLDFTALRAFRKRVLQLRPDVVQSWMYHSDFAASIVLMTIRHQKLFWGVHHANLDRSANKLSILVLARVNAILSYVCPRRIIYCAHSSATLHEKIGYAKSKRVVIPNGYDHIQFQIDDIEGQKFRTDIGVAEDQFLFGCVARWHPLKDHESLIKALLELKSKTEKPFKCVLAGRGIDARNQVLMDRIGVAGLQEEIILVGELKNVRSVYNALDIHILSSLGEAFPNVVAESMLCGTPCVVTDVGDAAYIVKDTGWVVPPSDSHALAGALLRGMHELQKDSDPMTKKVSVRNRVIENFTVDKAVARYTGEWAA